MKSLENIIVHINVLNLISIFATVPLNYKFMYETIEKAQTLYLLPNQTLEIGILLYDLFIKE